MQSSNFWLDWSSVSWHWILHSLSMNLPIHFPPDSASTSQSHPSTSLRLAKDPHHLRSSITALGEQQGSDFVSPVIQAVEHNQDGSGHRQAAHWAYSANAISPAHQYLDTCRLTTSVFNSLYLEESMTLKCQPQTPFKAAHYSPVFVHMNDRGGGIHRKSNLNHQDIFTFWRCWERLSSCWITFDLPHAKELWRPWLIRPCSGTCLLVYGDISMSKSKNRHVWGSQG